MKAVTLDIDGVLNNYPFCWLEYIRLQRNEKFDTIDEAKKKLGQETYSQIKENYRTSGYKSTLPVNPFAAEFTKSLKQKGYEIIVSTSRPFHLYPGLEKLTLDWLKANQITFDRLEKKSERLLTDYSNIQFHVDDELDHTIFFLENDIDVFIVKRDDIKYEDYEKYKSLRFVDTLNDVLAFID
jgi:hypothetical protein